jgi:DNA-binding IclR family transcriptional regulator
LNKNEKKRDPNILTSLNHALRVLDLISVRGNLGVSELARVTGYDKSSVYKMLYTLEHRGYVIKTANAHYIPSKKIVHYGTAATGNITDAAIPYMRSLRDECGETVYLGVLNTSGRVITVHKEEGKSPDCIVTRVGYELDVYTIAAGKILLANLDMAMRTSILRTIRFKVYTPQTITSMERLKEELQLLRGAPVAEQYDENYPGHADLASPLFGDDGHCLAVLSIVCHTGTLKQRAAEFRPLLIKAANSISQSMGYTPQGK